MSTVEGPGGHRYVVGRPDRAEGDHTERVAWPDQVAELVAERFGLPERERWVEVVDDETPAMLRRRLNRVASGLTELARVHPEVAVDIERLRRAAWGDTASATARRRRALRLAMDESGTDD